MGALGSGAWRKPGRRKTVGSYWVLDANYLSAQGCLEPSWSGTCQFQGTDSNESGNEAISINLRADAERLILFWRSYAAVSSAGTAIDVEIIPIVRMPCRFGGSQVFFLCPGLISKTPARHPLRGASAGPDDGMSNRTDAGADAGAPATEAKAGARCGRRVTKLHFARARFLCRHCSGLVYACQYERPEQRALRRVNKLWRRLDECLDTAHGNATTFTVPDYERLLAEALQAETQATEVQVAQLQRLIAWLDHRRKPEFTL
jgi:hypothetical protein